METLTVKGCFIMAEGWEGALGGGFLQARSLQLTYFISPFHLRKHASNNSLISNMSSSYINLIYRKREIYSVRAMNYFLSQQINNQILSIINYSLKNSFISILQICSTLQGKNQDNNTHWRNAQKKQDKLIIFKARILLFQFIYLFLTYKVFVWQDPRQECFRSFIYITIFTNCFAVVSFWS